MTGQLTFNLPVREAFSRADFYPSPANAQALAAVEGWRDWPEGRLLLLGPAGSGKSHLAHIWAAETGAIWLDADRLADHLAEVPEDAAVVLDGAERFAGQEEPALFHLCNRLSPHGRLLLTAAKPPRDWGLDLPDLLSRLQAMPVARLDAPDDALLAAVLVKLLSDRQITAPANLVAYLLPRMERSIAAARALIAALDARALASHRPITRQLAAEVLDLGSGE